MYDTQGGKPTSVENFMSSGVFEVARYIWFCFERGMSRDTR